MPDSISEEELLALAKEAHAEVQQEDARGRRDMAEPTTSLGGGPPEPEGARYDMIADAARKTAVGLGHMALSAGAMLAGGAAAGAGAAAGYNAVSGGDPRMDMADVFHEVANLAQSGQPLGEAGDIAGEWVEAFPEDAMAAESVGAQLLGSPEASAFGEALSGDGRADMGLGNFARHVRRHPTAYSTGLGSVATTGGIGAGYAAGHYSDDPDPSFWKQAGVGMLGGPFGLAGYHAGRMGQEFEDPRMDMMQRQDMYMGRQDMMDRQDMERMDMMQRQDMMNRQDMAIPGMGAAQRGWGRMRGQADDLYGRAQGQAGNLRERASGMYGGARGRASDMYEGGMDRAADVYGGARERVAANPMRYGIGAGAAGLGAAGGAGFMAGRAGGVDDDPRTDMDGGGRKAALWKKIAAAAGIGAGAAGAAGAGFAGGRATRDDGRTDMAAMQNGQAGQRKQSAPANQGQQQSTGAGEDAAQRDVVLKQAVAIAPDSNFEGLNERQILETLYKDEPNLKTMATDRLRGRLDMEVVGARNAQKYIVAGDALGIREGGGGNSVGMTLRAMENGGLLK